jgi:ketosteroid isomerase-like protein
MTAHAKSVKDEIVALEKSYWDAMKKKDGRRTAELSGDPALVTGPHGVMKIPKAKMAKMTEEGEWTLESYAFDNIEVSTPLPDVAIITYTVEQKVKMNGKPQTMRAADSSTWIRGASGWECHAHSESLLNGEKKAA